RTRNRENEISVRRWRSGGKSPRLDGQAIPKLLILLHGQVVEWLMAPHSKCGDPLRGSWVRIPPCPPVSRPKIPICFFDLFYPFVLFPCATPHPKSARSVSSIASAAGGA